VPHCQQVSNCCSKVSPHFEHRHVAARVPDASSHDCRISAARGMSLSRAMEISGVDFAKASGPGGTTSDDDWLNVTND
jgi:hypothetical protein